MKSSKKFMTRVLTAALALSMVAGTGICAAAVEDTEPTETTIVIAPADGNNDLSEKLDTLKEMLSEAAQTAYAKLSQTTLARLAKVVQKVKAADEIMVNAYAQDAELKTNFANQLIQIGEDAEKLIASADNDEEFEAQIMAVVQEKVEKLSAEVEAQSAENMAAAQAESDALLEEANAELEAIKAELQNKKTKAAEALKAKVDAIQQQIDAVKEQAEAAAQQAKDAIDQTAVAKLVKAQLKTKMAEKIMKEAEIQDAQIKVSVAEQVAQIRTETDELIAAIGDDEELVAGIQEQINQKIDQLLNDALAQLDQIWADAEEQAGALLAEADALTEEGQAQVSEEVTAFREMLVRKIDAVKEEINTKILKYEAYARKIISDIQAYIIDKTTKITPLDEGEFQYLVYSNCLTDSVTATLTDYTGEETEITVPAYTEEGIPVTSIDEGAFADCTNLTKLEIPAEITSIGENAFIGTAEDFTIYCYSDSYAQQYAEENGINYELLDAEEEDFYIDVSIIYEDENAYEDNVMALGTSVRFVAEGVNGVGNCTYSCYYRKVGDEKWTVKQGMKTHSEANEFSLTPKTAGDYEVCIKVIDSEKTLKKIYHEFTVEEKVETGSFISADTITLGESVTATAVPEDGMENCTYAFYFKRTSGDVWTKKQGFDTNNVVTITPDYATDYQICIKIKDENGSISKKYFDLQVVAPVEE